MVIIGIDPSLSNTAVAIGDGVGEPLVKCFPSSPDGNLPMQRARRCREVAQRMCDWISGTAKGIDLRMFMEGYSYGSINKSEVLAEHRAALFDAIHETFAPNDTCLVEVPPNNLKKFVTGKGNSQKEEMRLGAYKHWGVEFKTNDEVDAYGLYRFGLCVAGLAQASNAAQREAVDALLAPKPKKPRKKRQAQS